MVLEEHETMEEIVGMGESSSSSDEGSVSEASANQDHSEDEEVSENAGRTFVSRLGNTVTQEEMEDRLESQEAEDYSSEGEDSSELESSGGESPDDDDDEMAQGSNENEASEDDSGQPRKSGWADAMSKVLNMKKDIQGPSKDLLLVKAKKDMTTTTTSRDNKEAPKEDLEQKRASAKRSIQREVENRGRRKPCLVADRAKEKALAKVATRGVVQLFNAVREQQTTIKARLTQAGRSQRKRDKVYKTIDKQGFLHVLQQQDSGQDRLPLEPVRKKARAERSKGVKVEVKEEDEDDEKEVWDVIRDDFMMGAKMKDWDKEDDDHSS